MNKIISTKKRNDALLKQHKDNPFTTERLKLEEWTRKKGFKFDGDSLKGGN